MFGNSSDLVQVKERPQRWIHLLEPLQVRGSSIRGMGLKEYMLFIIITRPRKLIQSCRTRTLGLQSYASRGDPVQHPEGDCKLRKFNPTTCTQSPSGYWLPQLAWLCKPSVLALQQQHWFLDKKQLLKEIRLLRLNKSFPMSTLLACIFFRFID